MYLENPGLQRGLQSRHVNLIALGGIIGSAYFLGTGYLLNQLGPGAFLAYVFGGLITYMTLACLAELEVASPSHGSFIGYATEYVSPSWACGVGWSYWVTWVIYIPSECLAGGIVLNHYFPEIPVYFFAFGIGLGITLLNLSHVKYFGEIEFWLSVLKIIALVGFSAAAILIYFGVIGTGASLKAEYIFDNGGLFPNGMAVLLINMVILLVNYQGSEIIGLSASEAEDPKTAVPSALKKITYRIIGLYLIPIFLLALIFPWQEANLQGSVFGKALSKYGIVPADMIFNLIIVIAAVSCSNSGFYATVRALYGLGRNGMAPKKFTRLNSGGMPTWAIWASIGAIWIMLILSYFFSAKKLYTNLLAISGFTGAICWISICWSQLRYRRQIEKMNPPPSNLYKAPWFPYLTHLGIWLQVICLLVVAVNPHLRSSFYFGVPVLLIPILIYKLKHRRPAA